VCHFVLGVQYRYQVPGTGYWSTLAVGREDGISLAASLENRIVNLKFPSDLLLPSGVRDRDSTERTRVVPKGNALLSATCTCMTVLPYSSQLGIGDSQLLLSLSSSIFIVLQYSTTF
jgi:hypothetical protein